jgi:hypothetical protein
LEVETSSAGLDSPKEADLEEKVIHNSVGVLKLLKCIQLDVQAATLDLFEGFLKHHHSFVENFVVEFTSQK